MEKDGLVLLARRKEGGALAGKWEFPGGKLEPGETPEACLKRELAEEFGVEAEIGAFVASVRFDHRGESMELLAYRARHLSGEFSLNDHSEIVWAAPGELLAYDLAGADIPVARALLRK